MTYPSEYVSCRVSRGTVRVSMRVKNYGKFTNHIRHLQRFSYGIPHFPNCSYKMSIIVLTFLAYACYHMSRKPISVVKSVLHGNCSNSQAKLHEGGDCGYAPFGMLMAY